MVKKNINMKKKNICVILSFLMLSSLLWSAAISADDSKPPHAIWGWAEYESGGPAGGADVEIVSIQGSVRNTVLEDGAWQVDVGDPSPWPLDTPFTVSIVQKGAYPYTGWSVSQDGIITSEGYQSMGIMVLLPPEAPSISLIDAANQGLIAEPISFEFQLNDSNNLQTRLEIDFDGNGVVDETSEWIEGNQSITVNHSYDSVGIKTVKARCENAGNQYSSWVEHQLEIISPDGWDAHLTITETGGSNDIITFGEYTDAANGYDTYDAADPGGPPTPPYINSYFTTTFPCPNDHLMQEIKHYSPTNTNQTWNFSIFWYPNDYTSPTTTTITWNPNEINNSEYTQNVSLCDGTGTYLTNMLTDNSYTFTNPPMVPQNFQIICTNIEEEPVSLTLTTSGTGSGTIQANPPGPYTYGDTVTLTANPDTGSHFTQWNGDLTGTTNPDTITLNGDMTVDAQFDLDSAPEVPIVSGPTEVIHGQSASFSANSTDPEGQQIWYMFEWGDGSNSSWLGPVDSGIPIEQSHVWMLPIPHEIRVTAKDSTGLESGWSDPFVVSVANTPVLIHSPLPGNDSVGVSLEVLWNVTIADADGDSFDYSIACSNGQNVTGSNETDGIKTLPLSGLSSETTYTVWVNASDGFDNSSEVFSFTTHHIFHFDMVSGWNYITLPLESPCVWASDLASLIDDCLIVSSFNASSQSYQSYIVNESKRFDFMIEAGMGLVIMTTNASSFDLGGTPYESCTVELLPGWNAIGWFNNYQTTAHSLAENITSCQMVSWFDAELQTYHSFVVGGPDSFDFDINRGIGLFVLVDDPSIWYGAG